MPTLSLGFRLLHTTKNRRKIFINFCWFSAITLVQSKITLVNGPISMTWKHKFVESNLSVHLIHYLFRNYLVNHPNCFCHIHKWIKNLYPAMCRSAIKYENIFWLICKMANLNRFYWTNWTPMALQSFENLNYHPPLWMYRVYIRYFHSRVWWQIVECLTSQWLACVVRQLEINTNRWIDEALRPACWIARLNFLQTYRKGIELYIRILQQLLRWSFRLVPLRAPPFCMVQNLGKMRLCY